MDNIKEKFFQHECSVEQLIRFYDKKQEKNVKESGAIYTPWSIVNEMILLADIQESDKIVEPSCGHGLFLFGLLEYAQKTWSLSPVLLYSWFINKVRAIELSETVVRETREILGIYFARMGVTNVEFANIICADALTVEDSFDVAIGNPPYIRTKNINKQYLDNLRKSFLSCSSGNVDIYYAFIEHYTKLAKKMVFITPNSFLSNKSAKNLRKIITPRLNYLFDFKDRLIFKDARTYTCIFKLESISQDFLLNDKMTNKIQYFNEAPVERKTKVLSGIATLADSVFIAQKIGDKYYCNDTEIEGEVVVPLIKITKQKNNNLSSIRYILYPYRGKNIILESELREKYPLAYKYLLTQKTRLDQRDKGKVSNYEAWYAYGRKQGLHEYTEHKLTLIPQMIGPSCQPIVINVEQLLTTYKSLVFTSGFVIEGEAHNYLSKDFIDYAKTIGRPWPGKNESYYTLTSQQVAVYK